MSVNALNALMFGSDDDALHIAPLGTEGLETLTLSSAIPAGFEDVGWINDEGFNLELNDSTSVINGHQGGAVVRQFMESSETSLTAVLLESKVKTFETFFDTKGTKGKDNELKPAKKDIVTFDIPAARQARDLSAIVDLFDASKPDTKIRLIFPHVTLGARGELAFKRGEITAYKFQLQVIGGFKLITNHPGLIPA